MADIAAEDYNTGVWDPTQGPPPEKPTDFVMGGQHYTRYGGVSLTDSQQQTVSIFLFAAAVVIGWALVRR